MTGKERASGSAGALSWAVGMGVVFAAGAAVVGGVEVWQGNVSYGFLAFAYSGLLLAWTVQQQIIERQDTLIGRLFEDLDVQGSLIDAIQESRQREREGWE